MTEGDARTGAIGCDLGPEDARALLRAWLDAVDLRHERGATCSPSCSPTASRTPTSSAARAATTSAACSARWRPRSPTRRRSPRPPRRSSPPASPRSPTRPPTAFLGREKDKLATRDHEPIRVALVADGIGGMHGVTHTLDEIRERGVPGFEVEVIGTDPHVDRRLSAVAEVEIPFYPGLKVGVPSLPAVVEALAEGRYDVLHLCSPGPAGVAAAMIGRVHGAADRRLLPHRAGRLHGAALRRRRRSRRASRSRSAPSTAAATSVLSPSRGVRRAAARARHRRRGSAAGTAASTSTASRPTLRTRAADGRVRVLYAGRLTKEKGVDLLADAFLAARARDPRLELVLAGGGPEEDALRARLGGAATFLGWLEGDALARAYADADLFLFCSQTDTFGQVVLEAQASGLPVVAVDAGGPSELIASGRSGVLCPPRAERARRRGRRPRRLTPRSRRAWPRGGLAAVRERTWEASLAALGAGWRRALAAHEARRGGPRGMSRPAARPLARRAPPRCARLRTGAAPRRACGSPRRRGDAGGAARAAARRRRARCASSTSRCSTASAPAASAPTSTPRPRTRARTGAFEHQLVVPGAARDVSGRTCCAAVDPRRDLQRLPLAARHAARWSTCCASSSPTSCCCTTRSGRRARGARRVGVPVVMVHHGSLDLDAAALPGPHAALPARARRAGCGAPTRGADAVMSACDPRADTGRDATLPLRFGLDPAFYPEGDEQRGDHVLYAGRLSREKGVFELLEAAALAPSRGRCG